MSLQSLSSPGSLVPALGLIYPVTGSRLFKCGFLKDNHRLSAALTRELLRSRKLSVAAPPSGFAAVHGTSPQSPPAYVRP
jgi:hypothetical protein